MPWSFREPCWKSNSSPPRRCRSKGNKPAASNRAKITGRTLRSAHVFCFHRQRGSVASFAKKLLSKQLGFLRCKRTLFELCNCHSLPLLRCENRHHIGFDGGGSGRDRDHLQVGIIGGAKLGGMRCMSDRCKN